MSIGPQSRYLTLTGGSISRVANSVGVYNVTVFRTIPQSSSGFSLYTWMVGDRPDIVATKVLGNPTLWWEVFDLNPEIIDPLNVPPGTVIRVPTASVIAQGVLTQQ
jgi:hypothetical protein